MNEAPIQIRKPEAVRKIRRLSALIEKPFTEAVEAAVTEALERVEHQRSSEERGRLIDEALARYRALPKTGPMLTDEDLYDEDGFPR
ncbi:MAG TPA: type II toxin-antitoxin system VapB family antitoxin [Phenylobacterium sp.]|nr:type II toxin-antitoxin system VapB family antitoxin [Phenylobacterium sp.]